MIEEFLPARMDEAALAAAIDAFIAESGAAGLKDMGRVMALVKQRHAGEAAMSEASALAKARLGG